MRQIEALDVGRVFKVRIGHDGSGVADGWFLDTVYVKRLIMALLPKEEKKEDKKEEKKEDKKDKKKKKKKKGEEVEEVVMEWRDVVQTFTFTCGRWLARDENDGEIVLELRADDYDELEGMTIERE